MKKILLALLLTEVLQNGNSIKKIKTQLTNIMATLQEALDKAKELDEKVNTLQATVDAEQADIQSLVENNAQVVSDLIAQREALQAIIDAGGAAAEFQPVIDSLNATITKIEAANADVSSTV